MPERERTPLSSSEIAKLLTKKGELFPSVKTVYDSEGGLVAAFVKRWDPLDEQSEKKMVAAMGGSPFALFVSREDADEEGLGFRKEGGKKILVCPQSDQVISMGDIHVRVERAEKVSAHGSSRIEAGTVGEIRGGCEVSARGSSRVEVGILEGNWDVFTYDSSMVEVKRAEGLSRFNDRYSRHNGAVARGRSLLVFDGGNLPEIDLWKHDPEATVVAGKHVNINAFYKGEVFRLSEEEWEFEKDGRRLVICPATDINERTAYLVYEKATNPEGEEILTLLGGGTDIKRLSQRVSSTPFFKTTF